MKMLLRAEKHLKSEAVKSLAAHAVGISLSMTF